MLGKGGPGAYNLAGDGDITTSDLARALGWYSVPLPDIAVDATVNIVSRLPLMPAQASWLNAIRVPVLMDCSKARAALDWDPQYDALETLGGDRAGGERGRRPRALAQVTVSTSESARYEHYFCARNQNSSVIERIRWHVVLHPPLLPTPNSRASA